MKRIPTLIGTAKCVFTLAILLPAVCNAAAQNDVTLPAPTGPHQTGRMSFHWKDAAREELETKASDDKRELMVHLFYPADAKAEGNRAAYAPDADAMRGPWNDAQVARITTLRAFSREDAALPRGKARYPVIVFMPGGGMKALTYHTLLEDLASHGWVVAAIDPSYNARAVRFPDGRLLGNLPPAERRWPSTQNRDENLRYYQEFGSLTPQRNHRVRLRRPPRRNPARKECHCRQQEGGPYKRQRIGRVHAEQQIRHQPGQTKRRCQTDADAEQRQFQTLPDD
jgi:Platelet-activating factor acetylhydrolase, isoform II